MSAGQPITLILRDFAAGDKTALDRLMPLVYHELRKLADRHLRTERGGHTLQPTALVHEAYMRMVAQNQPDYRSRAHFMAVAARLMRQVLIDHARERKAGKRGGGEANIPLESGHDRPAERPATIIAVDDSLQALERQDPGKARLIEMRFFGGLTAEESAEVTGIPVEKVRAELRLAQAWLQRELDRSQSSS
jgi:RNA polymerase sigma factor (TIGR02999 family)